MSKPRVLARTICRELSASEVPRVAGGVEGDTGASTDSRTSVDTTTSTVPPTSTDMDTAWDAIVDPR
jgi:hypothetical protein